MDFNDIKTRLERTLSSLNARFDDNVEERIKITYVQSDHSIGMMVKFGNDDTKNILNKIFMILHNLASLKDHLKNCLKSKGYDQNIVETEINGSLHLQVLIDIVNQDKHGYPLTRTKRSGKNPVIKDPKQVLKLSTGTEPHSSARFVMSLDDGSYQINGQSTIAINADVCDDQGNILFGLDELVDTCFAKWENIAKTYSCS